MRCWESKEPFEEVLAEDPEVIEALGRDGLRQAFDVKAALVHCDVIFLGVLGVAGARAAEAGNTTGGATDDPIGEEGPKA